MTELARPANQLASVGVPLGPLPRPAASDQAWPIGMVGMWLWSLTDLPESFRRCDGQTLPANEFPDLAGLAGVAMGGTITLPNLNERFPVGVGADAALDTVRETGGSTGIAAGNLPAHAHPISSAGLHGHGPASLNSFYTSNPAGGLGFVNAAGVVVATEAATSNAGAHDHGGVTGLTGAGDAFRPPFMAVYFVIRVK